MVYAIFRTFRIELSEAHGADALLVELSDNPFDEIFDKVVQLLDKLQSKKLILQWQFKKMMPKREETELAHLYFNPKTHKV